MYSEGSADCAANRHCPMRAPPPLTLIAICGVALLSGGCAAGVSSEEAIARDPFAAMYDAPETEVVGTRAFYRSGKYLDLDRYHSVLIDDVRLDGASRDAELVRLAGEFSEQLRRRNDAFYRAESIGPDTLRIVSAMSNTRGAEGRPLILLKLAVFDSLSDRLIFGFEATTSADDSRDALIRWARLVYEKATGQRRQRL